MLCEFALSDHSTLSHPLVVSTVVNTVIQVEAYRYVLEECLVYRQLQDLLDTYILRVTE